jgi:hypothetical protein
MKTTKEKQALRQRFLDVLATTMTDNANDGVESIYQWVRISRALADAFDLTNDEKVYFLDKCGMDITIGTEWRNDYKSRGCGCQDLDADASK